jgi:hypothetical protein
MHYILQKVIKRQSWVIAAPDQPFLRAVKFLCSHTAARLCPYSPFDSDIGEINYPLLKQSNVNIDIFGRYNLPKISYI